MSIRGKVESGLSSYEGVKCTVKLSWPIGNKNNITSPYGMRNGRRHDGIDIAVSNMYGKPIKAADTGEVVAAVNGTDSRGKRVEILHPSGYLTVYFHNSKLNVTKGDTVSRGQKVAEAGSTGRSTGVHCHFGVYKGSYSYPSPYNPIDFLE
jgi:murein DD-endopeptidase MepM/ murein hydrolase activator NlpD